MYSVTALHRIQCFEATTRTVDLAPNRITGWLTQTSVLTWLTLYGILRPATIMTGKIFIKSLASLDMIEERELGMSSLGFDFDRGGV